MSSSLKRRCRWYWIKRVRVTVVAEEVWVTSHPMDASRTFSTFWRLSPPNSAEVSDRAALCFASFSQLLNKGIHRTVWLNTNNSPTALSLRGIDDRQQMKVVTAQKTYSPFKASFWISSLIMESISSSAFPVTFSFLFILSFCLLFRRKHNQTHWKAIMQWKLPWKIRGPTR